MTTLNTAQAKACLKAVGFDNADRAFTTAVTGFQTGFNLTTPLKADGKVGPLTSAALMLSAARAAKGQSTMSANFSFVEFRCNCGGRYANCRRIWEDYRHVRRLEAYRAKVGAVRIISGCRCPGRNKEVGGASNSQHQFGFSSDVQGLRSLADVKAMHIFAGLGFQGSTGRVVHADSRDLSGHNNGGSQASPMTWRYSW